MRGAMGAQRDGSGPGRPEIARSGRFGVAEPELEDIIHRRCLPPSPRPNRSLPPRPLRLSVVSYLGSQATQRRPWHGRRPKKALMGGRGLLVGLPRAPAR